MPVDAVAFEIDWEPAPGVRAPELGATWARLEIRVGDNILTQVEDSRSRSVRRAIHVPVYPLAEWVVFNWWRLRANRRLSLVPAYDWSFRARLRASHHRDWLLHHNVRAVGDGFLWPDLAIIPTDRAVVLAWQGDRHYPPGWRLRFLGSGTAEVDPSHLERTLASLVQAVLDRLADQEVEGTVLEGEWRELQDLDAEEASFCLAAARLGLDPLNVDEDVGTLIVRAANDLPPALLGDFLDAAHPLKLEQDLEWMHGTAELVATSTAKTRPLPTMQRLPLGRSEAWRRGLDDARALRSLLGLGEDQTVTLDDWVFVEHVERVDRALQALGGRSGRGAAVLGLAGARRPESERFAAARALWRFIRADGDERFLLTSSRSATQQAERAFAAEFLAPAAGVAQVLGSDADPLGPDEILDASEHFGVAEWVVEYQAINQLGRMVDDPGLERYGGSPSETTTTAPEQGTPRWGD